MEIETTTVQAKGAPKKAIWRVGDFMGTYCVHDLGREGGKYYEWRWYQELDEMLWIREDHKEDGGIWFWSEGLARWFWAHPASYPLVLMDGGEWMDLPSLIEVTRGRSTGNGGGDPEPEPEPTSGDEDKVGDAVRKTRRSFFWGYYGSRVETINEQAPEIGLAVLTRDDLGIGWSYWPGVPSLKVENPSQFSAIENRFFNARKDRFFSVPWLNVLDRDLGRVPTDLLQGRLDDVGFTSRLLDWRPARGAILSLVVELCKEGINPMLDWCYEDVGQLELIRAVKAIANQHGCRLLLNVSDGGSPFIGEADVVGFEVPVRQQASIFDQERWFSAIRQCRPDQHIDLRAWVDSAEAAQDVADIYGGHVDTLQVQSSETDEIDNSRAIMWSPNL